MAEEDTGGIRYALSATPSTPDADAQCAQQ